MRKTKGVLFMKHRV